MSATPPVARHPRPPELEGVSLEEIATRYVARFRDRKADWAAFEDAKIEGYKRAQHRFIGAGGAGKHADVNVIPPRNVAQFLSGPYKVPNIHMESFAVLTKQDPGGHLPRPGALRGRLLPRAADGHGGERPRHRPGGAPPPQPAFACRHNVGQGWKRSACRSHRMRSDCRWSACGFTTGQQST